MPTKIRDIKQYENIIEVDLDNKLDHQTVDRGVGGGFSLTEIHVWKNGKRAVVWISLSVSPQGLQVNVTAGGSHKQVTKSVTARPWRTLADS